MPLGPRGKPRGPFSWASWVGPCGAFHARDEATRLGMTQVDPFGLRGHEQPFDLCLGRQVAARGQFDHAAAAGARLESQRQGAQARVPYTADYYFFTGR